MTFDEVFSFTNLLKMHKKCRVCKSHKKETVLFELNLGQNLAKLSKEALNGYKVSNYKTFKIYEPKKRIIEALPYKDRLVQMALCKNIIEPVLEKRLIYDNCACRKGKGTHFAISRLERFLHKFFITNGQSGYFLKVDISKYFASIKHSVLKEKLKKCPFDTKTFDMMFAFIDSKNAEKGIGLPLGNQTSQWFALLYFDEIDRLIKEKLKIKFYLRYMDDLILLGESKQYLMFCRKEIARVCNQNLGLKLNSKTQVGKLCDGIDFLGFRHSLSKSGKVVRVLRKQAKQRLRKRLKLLKLLKQNCIVDREFFQIRINSFKAHLGYITMKNPYFFDV